MKKVIAIVLVKGKSFWKLHVKILSFSSILHLLFLVVEKNMGFVWKWSTIYQSFFPYMKHKVQESRDPGIGQWKINCFWCAYTSAHGIFKSQKKNQFASLASLNTPSNLYTILPFFNLTFITCIWSFVNKNIIYLCRLHGVWLMMSILTY